MLVQPQAGIVLSTRGAVRTGGAANARLAAVRVVVAALARLDARMQSLAQRSTHQACRRCDAVRD